MWWLHWDSNRCLKRTLLEKAVELYARAQADAIRMLDVGHEVLPHQQTAFNEAAHALDAIRPEAARDRVAQLNSPTSA